MKPEGHLKKAKEIKESLEKLLPDPEGRNVVAVVELSYGLLLHLCAYGLEMKHNQHLDTHVGLPKLLRELGEIEVAKDFERLDTLRQGRWYGTKGNGEVVGECLAIIESIEEWIK